MKNYVVPPQDHAQSSRASASKALNHSAWVVLAASLAVGHSMAQTIERVSVDSVGAQGNAASGVYGRPSISTDGRFVAFTSLASNIVAGDTNSTYDVFLRDRLTGTTERVSLNFTGAQGNYGSYRPTVSADGRFVAFDSSASNLVVGDTNNRSDVFVRDRQSGTTERVSVYGGAQGNSDSWYPSISADGRFVTFDSDSTNWSGSAYASDVYLHDRQSGATGYLSGSQYGMDSWNSSISADGRFVAFNSEVSNLVAGDTNGFWDVFVLDRQNGTYDRVSVTSAGAQGNSNSSGYPSISSDGRFVAFCSQASNLVAGDTNGYWDMFLRDRQSGTTERVSIDSAGVQGNASSASLASISDDGQLVAFSSVASNLVAGDTNGFVDIFVRNRLSGTTERVNTDLAGTQGNATSSNASISGDGRFVAFDSLASNFVAGDTNGFSDVFVREQAQPSNLLISRIKHVDFVYPDNTVSMMFYATIVNTGATATAGFNISGRGWGPTNFTSCSGSWQVLNTLSGFAPGEGRTVTFGGPGYPGCGPRVPRGWMFLVTAYADSHCAVVESNETDNSLTARVQAHW